MSDTEMQGDGHEMQEPDDGATPDAEMTPSNVDDPDPVGGSGGAEPSGVTPESGAWADASPDGFEGENSTGG